MHFKLNDQEKPIAVITGASKGIGRAIAQALYQHGYQIIGISRNPNKIPLKNRLPDALYYPLELTDETSIEAFIHQIKRVDILVNNAGSSQVAPIEEISIDAVKRYFQLGFVGVVQLTQGLIPLMRKQRTGWIFNISSLSGRATVPFSTFYAAAKSALHNFTRGLRTELHPFGIQAITIAPGPIKTSITQDIHLFADSPYQEAFSNAKKVRDDAILTGAPPEIVAKKIIAILEKKHPKPYYPVGKNATLQAWLMRHLPEKFAEKIIWKKYNQ